MSVSDRRTSSQYPMGITIGFSEAESCLALESELNGLELLFICFKVETKATRKAEELTRKVQ